MKPWSYEIDIPERWFVPDLEARDPAAEGADLVAERLGGRPDLRRWEQALVDTLTTFIEESVRREAVGAALLVDVIDDLPLTATIQVMAAGDRPRRADLGGQAPDDTRPRQLRDVELAGGPALRVAGARESITDGGRPGVIVEYVEHWLDVPDSDQAVLILGETPNLAFAGDIAGAVDQIVSSFRFVPARG
jgi:hypothetical protein